MNTLRSVLEVCSTRTALAATVCVIRGNGSIANPQPDLCAINIIEDTRIGFMRNTNTPIMEFFQPWLGINLVLTADSIMSAKPSPFMGWTRLKAADGTELDMKFHILAPLGEELGIQERACPLNNALQLFMEAYVQEVSGEGAAPRSVQQIVVDAHEEAAIELGVA